MHDSEWIKEWLTLEQINKFSIESNINISIKEFGFEKRESSPEPICEAGEIANNSRGGKRGAIYKMGDFDLRACLDKP